LSFFDVVVDEIVLQTVVVNLPDKLVVGLAFLENADHLVISVRFNPELAADRLVTLVRYLKRVQVDTSQK
jgi:hypothetical protein